MATAAARLLVKFGFGDLKLSRIEIMVVVDNKASQRVARKTGAMREGVLRSRWIVWEKVYDMVMFSLISQDIR